VIAITVLGLAFAAFVLFLLTQRASPETLEAHFTGRPEMRDTVVALRDTYPQEHRTFLAELTGIADAQGLEAANDAAMPWLRRFIAGKAEAIVNAPAADLHRLAVAMRDLLVVLDGFDDALCADFARRGAIEAERLPESVTAGIGRVNEALLRAARNGESGRGVRREAFGRAENAQLIARMQAIDPGLAARMAGAARRQETPAELCRRAVTVHRAAADLPEEASANAMAHLARFSFGRPRAASER
jgi:hypothetical protein